MIWLILAILTLVTLLYVCAPLYSSDAPAVVGEDIEAYRAETQNVSSEESLNFKRQLLKRAAPKVAQKDIPRVWLGLVFLSSIALAVSMYGSLGSPQWATSELQRVQPKVLPASPADAIAQMSPEDREAMINAMVDGLAARLREDPDDVDGWVRLLRSRQVLQQDAADDLALMRETFEGQPEIIKNILERSERTPQQE